MRIDNNKKSTTFTAIKVNKETFEIIAKAKKWDFGGACAEPNPNLLRDIFVFDSSSYKSKKVVEKADKIKAKFNASEDEIILNSKEKTESKTWSEILHRKWVLTKGYLKKDEIGYGPKMIKDFQKKSERFLKENVNIPGEGNEKLDYRTISKAKLHDLHLKFVNNIIKNAKPVTKEKVEAELTPLLTEKADLSSKLQMVNDKIQAFDFE